MGTAKSFSLSDVKELAKTCCNWGKWGPDDELGTLNYITPDKIVAAARLVKQGKTISVGIPFDDRGPQSGSFGRFNPIHFMLQDGGDAAMGAQAHLKNICYSDDAVTMPLQCATQWDALAHIFFEGKMYNGYPQGDVNSLGAKRNGIEKMKSKILGRGVFLDIPRYKGKRWLEEGEAIYPEDLEECARTEGVTIGSGDIVLIRTGQMAEVADRGTWGTYSGGNAPGLSVLCGPWLHKREVAGIATDTWGIDVRPNESPDVFQPLHVILLVNAGMLMGEIFSFEELSRDCAGDGVYEFLFSAPPLPITGAVGSPINPQVIK